MLYNESDNYMIMHEKTPMLQKSLEEISKYYDFSVQFVAHQQPGFIIDGTTIYYNSINDGLRGLGNFISKSNSSESTRFTDRCVMLDCSRGAVPLLDTLYAYIRLLALLGYNQFMLYCEDTYACNHPQFGYLRGRYTQQEIIAIDNYCLLFGIELIPCIQLLGHLENLLQYPSCDKTRDTKDVLLVGADETYALLNKMLDFWSIVKSKRIHIGLDETYGLGTGEFKKKYGQQPFKTIFLSHLSSILSILEKRQLRPLMWSDMLFNDGSDNYYSNQSSQMTVSSTIDYVYWDYFHTKPQHYKDRIQQHRSIGITNNLVCAPGASIWNRFWCLLPFAFKTADACISACTDSNVTKIIYTFWGDDLNEYDITSSFPALIHMSELLYNTSNATASKFESLCGGCLQDFITASYIDNPMQVPYTKDMYDPGNIGKSLLWNDPILNFLQPQVPQNCSLEYDKISKSLIEAISKQKKYPLNRRLLMPCLISQIVSIKLNLKQHLLSAYLSKSISKVEQAIQDHLKPLEYFVDRLWRTHRYLFLSHYKPFGFEVLEGRYGALILRLKSLHERLLAYVAYLKNGEQEDGFDWFNSDVFPLKLDDDPTPMELYDMDKMDISLYNLKSTDKIDDYKAHIELMLPLRKMEDLEVELEKIWDIDASELKLGYIRSQSMFKNIFQ